MPIRNSITIEYALRCGRFVEIEIFLATSRETEAKQKFVSFFINIITNASFLQLWSKIKHSNWNSINIYFSIIRNINCEWNRHFFQRAFLTFYASANFKVELYRRNRKIRSIRFSQEPKHRVCAARQCATIYRSRSHQSKVPFLLFLAITKSCCNRVAKRAIIKYKLNVLFVSDKTVRRQIVASESIAS